MKKQSGAAILIITVILLVAALLMMLYSAQNTIFQQKTSSNIMQESQAFEAAEAGLEYAVAYLQNNSSTVIANPSGGFINYNISTVTLANNSNYTVHITNPNSNNYNLLTIQSTGKNSDGTATKVVTQQVDATPGITVPLISMGSITMSGGSSISNLNSNSTIQSASTISMSGGSATYLSSGQSSTQSNYKSDVQQNVAQYQGLTESQYFQTVFNTTETAEKTNIQNTGTYYNNTVSNGNYTNLLNGVTGKAIWIDQTNGNTVSINGGGIVVGSAAAPVLLIVEGDFTLSGGAKVYGIVYASGLNHGVTISGGSQVIGSLLSAGNITLSGGSGSFQSISGQFFPGTKYTKVSGSWKDF